MPNKIEDHDIRLFLEKHFLATLSTVDEEGRAHAAPVYYLAKRTGEVLFVTPSKTRKSLNLEHHNEVVLTVTDEAKFETVQIRGRAHKDEKRLARTLGELAHRVNLDPDSPVMSLPLHKYTDQSKTVVVVKPTEIRFRKFHHNELEEVYMNLDS